MPAYAAELYEWWLTSGRDHLIKLASRDDIDAGPRDCGFAQAVQCKLLDSDRNSDIQDKLRDELPGIRAGGNTDFVANHRKTLGFALRKIFRNPETVGMEQDVALQGLTYLDAMEAHRRRLLSTAEMAINNNKHHKDKFDVIEELHRASLNHYAQFHMGFRASILIYDLCQELSQAKGIIELLARLNSLFPPVVHLLGPEDLDLTPYSNGLRDSIRLSVLQHLMGDDPFSEQQQQSIRLKILGWCAIPHYDQAWSALIRYSEETKKFEQLCWETLHAIEQEQLTSAYKANNHLQEKNLPQPLVALDNTVASIDFAHPAHQTSPAPPVPNPLLKGMPGREISGSRTDGAAFAGDTEAAPVLTYPWNLSATEFDQHPLSKYLDMSSAEKARLGLILPKQVASRDF